MYGLARLLKWGGGPHSHPEARTEVEAVRIKAEDKTSWDAVKSHAVLQVLGSGRHFISKGDIPYRRSILEGHKEMLGMCSTLSSRAAAKTLELEKQPKL